MRDIDEAKKLDVDWVLTRMLDKQCPKSLRTAPRGFFGPSPSGDRAVTIYNLELNRTLPRLRATNHDAGTVIHYG